MPTLLLCAALPFGATAGTAPFLYGWNTHLAPTYRYGTLPRLVDQLLGSGANSYRDTEEWNWSEYQTPGLYRYGADLDAAAAQVNGRLAPAGLAGLQILGFDNTLYWQQASQDITISPNTAGSVFQTYVGGFKGYARQQLIRRTGQKYYQIGNEWNGGFHLNPAMPNYTLARDGDTYARLYLSIAAELRTRAPAAQLLTGGLADCPASPTLPYGTCWPWLISQLDHLKRLGGNLKLVDGLGIHAYADYDPVAVPERLYSGLVTGRQWLLTQSPAYAAEPKDFYLTETGFPTITSSGKTIAEPLQADYLQRMALLLRTLSYVKGVWFYQLADLPIAGREGSFGALSPTLVPRPALAAMRTLAPLIINGSNWRLLKGDVKTTAWSQRLTDQWILYRPTTLYAIECDYTDPADRVTKRITAFWAPQGTLPVQVTVTGTTRVAYRTGFTMPDQLLGSSSQLTATSTPQFLIRPLGATGTVTLK